MIYHLNLLKPQREEYPVVLVMVMPKREDLESELSVARFTLVPCEDNLSPSQRAPFGKLQKEVCNVFSP